ncbi:MAG: hypothetical protein H0V96_10200 [Acidimicrobiia bacterium]|nr:hypothetical protein [Acidimicrobiia bacterium]
MHTVYVDAHLDDETRRRKVYQGQIFTFAPRPSTLALIDHARSMIEEAFPGMDPRYAQFEMPVQRYVEIVAPLKPRFIHNETTKGLIREVLAEFGCDLERTYQDVPRLRMVTSDAYLTSGVGYAHHMHRDAWYAAPHAQLNWWLPVYDIESECSMAFHPRYWTDPVENGSAEFNYYEWNAVGRKSAATQVTGDTRKQPRPVHEIDPDPQVRFVVPVGGVVLFSGVQLHSTVPNTSGFTRYSIDFRTVNIDDVIAGIGAPNIDNASTGTSLRDFKRASDMAEIPEAVVAPYDIGPKPPEGVLVYTPGS